MKLSGKGVKRAIRWCCVDPKTNHAYLDLGWDALPHYEFEPDDFQGCVVLTTEEAKAVLECVDACAFPSPFEGFVSKTILLRDRLTKQITQAEKGNE